MKTKILCLLLAMFAAMAMFVACDGGEEQQGGGGGTTVTPPADAPKYDVTWKKEESTLKIKYSTASQASELISGCERYYAGEGAYFAEIDDLIDDRNLYAETAAGVTVQYDQFKSNEGWSATAGLMVTEASAGTNVTDIYYNFVYDISGAQLNGCFANIKSDNYANGNHFLFNKAGYVYESDNYFDSSVGGGYFYQYMQSLSLNNNKMYAVASDFCTDLVRAFLVVPVNVTLLETITPEKSWTGDMKNDVSEFYNLVWRTEDKYAEGWSYNVLAKYSAAIASPDNTSDHALAGTVGFAAGKTSGLVSSGLLYTAASVTIIEEGKKADGTKTPTYPATNSDLNNLVSTFNDNFGKTGIVAVEAGSDFSAIGDNEAKTELQAIRNRFAQGKVLFGGVVALGSLDEDVYQNMMVDGGKGFGVLPIPVYQSSDDYLTLVHNLAKVVAIAKNTTKFSQCSAYIDYLSQESDDVLDSYYNQYLVSKTGGKAAEANKNMLTYIRTHVKDAFAKTVEDAIGIWKSNDADVTANKFHEIIARSGFELDDFTGTYAGIVGKKQDYLNEAVTAWNNHQ